MSKLRSVPLRQVPGDSVVHRLWAGTKLIIVLMLGALTWILPSWPALITVFLIVVAIAVIAGIPLGAIPRPPWWFWALLFFGAGMQFIAGAEAVLVFLRAAALALVVVASSILVIWTTPLAEVAPAIARLMWPLRKLRLPVDEWAVSIALCLRGLPLLIEEFRLLRASHRLRPKAPNGSRHPAEEMGIMDMVVAAMSSALRRSAEMAEAITARGGTGRLTAYQAGPQGRDYAAVAIIAAACATAITLSVLFF